MRSLIAALILLLTPLAAGDSRWPQHLPFEECGDYFLVQMLVGDDAERPLSMLLDTGAAHTVIDIDSLERVSGKRLESGKWARFELVTAGDVKFSNMRMRARQIDHLQLALGAQLDGILGFEAFRDVLLTIDYGARIISIEPGQLGRPDGKTIFKDVYEKSRPFIRVDFDGTKIPILLDSGSSGGWSITPKRSLEWETPPVEVASALKINRVQREYWARMANSIGFAGQQLERPTLDLAEGTELVGTKVMGYYRFTFDQKKRRVKIESNGSEVPFHPRRAPGWAVGVKQDGYKIVEVYDGFGASRAGLQVDDVVLEIDGTPVFERELCDRSWKNRVSMEVLIQRGDEQLTRTVELDLVVP